ncbi:MAG: rhodanese-like domain-containing protein [Candidatus Brocadiaceae bacterium]|nr:rhodanese-like domain-containing protein [Candidatus Brocadiaceae bacterium]
MKHNNFFILILMSVVTGIATMPGCSQNQEALTWPDVIRNIRNKYPDVNQLQTDELHSSLSGPKSETIILIDARTKEEFQISHIPGAKNMPYNKNPLKHLTDIKPDSPIVVYCSVGYRSSILARKLHELGFKKVYNLEGSIFKWANEGKPLVQEQTTVYKVHPYNTNWGRLLEKKYHSDAD